VSNENFWRTAFTQPVNTPSQPFTIGTDVIVIEAQTEEVKDAAYKDGIAEAFGAEGWTANTAETSFRSAVFSSDKLQNNFDVTYMGMQLQSMMQ